MRFKTELRVSGYVRGSGSVFRFWPKKNSWFVPVRGVSTDAFWSGKGEGKSLSQSGAGARLIGWREMSDPNQ